MRFKDFRIEIIQEGGFLSKEEYETIDETLMNINNWVEENEYIVLNIETLLFPGLEKSNLGTSSAKFKSSQIQHSHNFYQVFKAWYKESRSDGYVKVNELV